MPAIVSLIVAAILSAQSDSSNRIKIDVHLQPVVMDARRTPVD